MEPKLWYQSATIRNAIAVIIVQLVAISAEVTGRVYDLDQIKFLLDNGMPLAFDAISMFFGYRAIKSRMKADEPIKQPELPWRKGKP